MNVLSHALAFSLSLASFLTKSLIANVSALAGARQPLYGSFIGSVCAPSLGLHLAPSEASASDSNSNSDSASAVENELEPVMGFREERRIQDATLNIQMETLEARRMTDEERTKRHGERR